MTIPEALALVARQYQAGQLREAGMVCRGILQVDAEDPDARRWLGLIAHASGKPEDALALIEPLLAAYPRSVDLLNDHGMILLTMKEPERAADSFADALKLAPRNHHVLCNLGNALQAQARTDEALACYLSAIALDPAFAEAHHNSGKIYHERARYEQALAAFETALRLQPAFAGAFRNMARTLQALNRPEEALEAMKAADRLEPNNALTQNAIGLLMTDLGRPDDAIAAFQRALDINPSAAEARGNLASVMADNGDLEAAVRRLEELVAEHPNHAGMHGNYIYLLPFHPGYDASAILLEARRWNDRHAAPLKSLWAAHERVALVERRLRVGYVSPNLCDHVVGRNLLPLLREHDHARFEIFCYSGAPRADDVTALLRTSADHWRDTCGISDANLAAQIRNDGIDLLVDAALHMQGGRLLAFARKPAPVQITFAGYPGTTGLAAMDYRLTDPFLDPPGANDDDYSETSLRLPDSFWCYDPLERDIAVGPLPASELGSVTFGCLNNSRKVNAAVLALWARVLTAVPGSQLILEGCSDSHRKGILGRLRESGVDGTRVTFVGKCSRREYLARYGRLDIALDTFPYNGHTTSLDALWMGVPVVTKVGRTVVSRGGLSQLTNLGFPEWVAQSDAEFVAIACDLAGDLSRLAALRASLRERMEASPLMDASRFARGVEAAYLTAWDAYGRDRKRDAARRPGGP